MYGFARRWEQLEVAFLNVSLTVRDFKKENCALVNQFPRFYRDEIKVWYGSNANSLTQF